MHDRKKERSDLIRLLKSGTSVQLLAPRRVGKTWLIKKVAEDLAQEGQISLLFDVEGFSRVDQFWRALCQLAQEPDPAYKRLANHASQRFRQAVAGDWDENPLQAFTRVDYESFAEVLISTLNKQNEGAVILVDEIAVFALALLKSDAEAANEFFSRLRRLRQEYPHVRWILTGSIGLEVVAKEASLQGTLIDLEVFELKPFDKQAARSYIEALSRIDGMPHPFDIADDDFGYLAKQLGWLAPFYLKLIADRIRPTGEKGCNGWPTATQTDIDKAIDDLLEPKRRGCFAVWEEHIKKNFDATTAKTLRLIMSHCCETVEGKSEVWLFAFLSRNNQALTRATLTNLLAALSNDGILHETDGQWKFCSGLLRRYWLRYCAQ